MTIIVFIRFSVPTLFFFLFLSHFPFIMLLCKHMPNTYLSSSKLESLEDKDVNQNVCHLNRLMQCKFITPIDKQGSSRPRLFMAMILCNGLIFKNLYSQYNLTLKQKSSCKILSNIHNYYLSYMTLDLYPIYYMHISVFKCNIQYLQIFSTQHIFCTKRMEILI